MSELIFHDANFTNELQAVKEAFVKSGLHLGADNQQRQIALAGEALHRMR